jgi:hypothetical protein
LDINLSLLLSCSHYSILYFETPDSELFQNMFVNVGAFDFLKANKLTVYNVQQSGKYTVEKNNNTALVTLKTTV